MKVNKDKIIGAVFCIPLFMPKDDWKLKVKLTKDDLSKNFAFGRVIETSSSVLVEIFNYIGCANSDLKQVINSGIMYSPIQIFWDGIIKKRWKIIEQTENYDKYKDSNYNNLKMVFGGIGFRLRDFSTKKETPITREEVKLKEYEFSTVWFPIDLENRILKRLEESRTHNKSTMVKNK
ncbi:Imm26 family immunity protein [Algibacter sp. TI.3.09]|uniref:Imm26 family immunity protein n=1 Tax=Algibacter sp. TI.3.09 TaxID=3121298 RepID=UPI00311EDAD8